MFEGAQESHIRTLKIINREQSGDLASQRSIIRETTNKLRGYYEAHKELKIRFNKLKLNYMEEVAISAARKAQCDALYHALKEINPEHNLLKASNKMYNTGEFKGKKKSVIRVMYEEKFDQILRKYGIVNPAAYRED